MVRVQVLDARGRPLPGSRVTVVDPVREIAFTHPDPTDRDGVVTVDATGSDLTIRVQPPGREAQSVPLPRIERDSLPGRQLTVRLA